MEGRTIIISEINKSNYFIYLYVMLLVKNIFILRAEQGVRISVLLLISS